MTHLNRVEQTVLRKFFELAGLSADLASIGVIERRSSVTGFMTELNLSSSPCIPDRETRFPRVFGNSEFNGIADGQPVGFLLFFDGERIAAIEGYACLEVFPSEPSDFRLARKEEVESIFDIKLS